MNNLTDHPPRTEDAADSTATSAPQTPTQTQTQIQTQTPPTRGPKPSALTQTLRYTLRLLILAASFGGAWLWVGPEVQDALAGRARPKPSADAKAGKKPPLTVEVDTARRVTLPILAQGTGTIRARQKVDIVSERARRLVKVHVRSGQAVAAGDPLFTLDAADLRARLSTLRTQLGHAQRLLDRTQTLAKSGATPQAELDAALARVDDIKRAQAEVQVELNKTTLSAPFAGTIGLIDLTEGALLQPSQRITTLYDVSSLEVDALLPERYASALQAGQLLTAQITGREGDLHGRVLVVEPTIDRATRSVVLRASLNDLSGGFDGAFASISVEVQAADALLISSLAVIPGLEGRQVLRVIDGVVKATPVTLGDRSPTHIQVLSGLAEGDVVAVSNLLRLRDGAAVTRKEPVDLPAQGLGVPAQGLGVPAQGLGLPAEGVDLPAEGVGLPAEGLDLPAEGVGLPAQGLGVPAEGLGVPATPDKAPPAPRVITPKGDK